MHSAASKQAAQRMCACCCETIASALVLLRVWHWMQWQHVALQHAALRGCEALRSFSGVAYGCGECA